jgi:radical SAM superfamily enzyme YgiQ (UPF0313 family)
MKIALIFPPFFLEPMYNMPPLGLINIATALKGSPHQVKIFDFPLAIRDKTLDMGPRIYDSCAEQILEFDPDLAGFSVQCTTYPPALRIAEKLKERERRIRVVFGGHNASFVDEATLARHPCVDAIVRGEGEETFPELMAGFEGKLDLQDIDGITYRSGDRIMRNPDRRLIEDLDSLPLADYTLVPPFSVYRDVCGIPRSIAILEIGRGCPHQCIYCSQSLIWRRRTRTFSIERLIAEMKSLSGDFGAECFLLAYDQFTAKRSFAEEFCRCVIDSRLSSIPWYCISRLDTVDDRLLKLMREAGCESMCYGIDSGSRKTLAFIRKNIDHDVLLQRVRETTRQGIVPTLSFVTGFPAEAPADLEDTLRLVLKSSMAGSVNILMQMATILPGTDLYRNYSGFLVREVDTYFSLGIEFDGGRRLQADEDLIDSDSEIFSSFYNLPSPAGSLADLNDIAGYFPILASLYPRSFFLLAMELDRPLLDLFFSFLRYIREEKETGDHCLTPANCGSCFEEFATELLRPRRPLTRKFLPELIRYESCLLRLGKTPQPATSFDIDLGNFQHFKPLMNDNILIEQFPFRIPIIILDAQNGAFADHYPEEQTYIIFTMRDRQVEVKEVNDFGADFILLCDGQRSLDTIAQLLYPKYGGETNSDTFVDLCAEAARALVDLSWLLPGLPRNPEEKGGEKDVAGKGS